MGELGPESRESVGGDAEELETARFQQLQSPCGSSTFSVLLKLFIVCARVRVCQCVSISPLPGFSHTLPLKPISTFFKKPEDYLNLSKGLGGQMYMHAC